MNQRLRGNFLLGLCVGLAIAIGAVAITTYAQLSDEQRREKNQGWSRLSDQERKELMDSITAQSKRWDELSEEERKELVEWIEWRDRMAADEYFHGGVAPDTESPDWRFLSEDVGLMVYAREKGVAMARLFLRVEGGGWLPLATDDGTHKSVGEFMLANP